MESNKTMITVPDPSLFPAPHSSHLRMGYIDQLTQAKENLWDGKGTPFRPQCLHICNALPKGMPHTESLQELIEGRLGHATYLRWYQTINNLDPSATSSGRVQQLRHAWVNDLIREFSQ